jgi:pyruvate dehydrogenase E2 component (dihydrolipoamide acetyltransferase)
VAHDSVSIGVAIHTDAGLTAPVIADADRLNLQATSQALRALTERAREGRLKPADIGPKSLVISNLGMYRVDAFIAIIDMPDPMILAVGQVAERVVPLNGQITIQPMCTLTLSVDHRALDGVPAARFLERIKARLENPFDILSAT